MTQLPGSGATWRGSRSVNLNNPLCGPDGASACATGSGGHSGYQAGEAPCHSANVTVNDSLGTNTAPQSGFEGHYRWVNADTGTGENHNLVTIYCLQNDGRADLIKLNDAMLGM